MVTIKQYIKLLVHLKYICTISKNTDADIANFAISATNILLIRYIGAPLA